MWTIAEAKSELDDLLQRASAGQPQVIDAEQRLVVIPMSEYEHLTRARNMPHLGRWLVDNAPRVGDIELPPRSKERPVPFDDWSDEDLAT